MKRRFFFASLVGLAPAAAQQLPTVTYQHALNPPICPVCRNAVLANARKIMILGINDVIDGSTLPDPALVCPTCGHIFCIQP